MCDHAVGHRQNYLTQTNEQNSLLTRHHCSNKEYRFSVTIHLVTTSTQANQKEGTNHDAPPLSTTIDEDRFP